MGPYSQKLFLKIIKNGVPRITVGVLEPTWARFGAENVPRTYFDRSGVVFGRFWKDFGRNLDKSGMNVQ